jgi:hypothetical protein
MATIDTAFVPPSLALSTPLFCILSHAHCRADEQGMVVATDTAFMSTSRARSTPLAYMGDGENVLWELQPRR